MFRITRILKNLFSLSSFKFILILWIIININKVQSQFTLKRRFTHNAHLFDNKLWFFGGGTMVNGMLSPTGDVFYVDLTKPFDTANVPYVAKAASPFSCAWCQSAIGGVNQSKIFFFAGAMVKQDSPKTLTDTIVYSFDIKTQTWSIPPQMTGMTYSRRRELQPVSKNGKIYLFGGGADMSLGRPNIQVFNDMNILDSINNIWTTGPSLIPPVSKIDYTATLLPNGNIIYIGGSRSDVNIIRFDAVSMNQVSIKFVIKIFRYRRH
jgi:N-acetylneuraminic acid mutarotase